MPWKSSFSQTIRGWSTSDDPWVVSRIPDPRINGVFRDPLIVSFPYYSHTTPIRISKDMGIVWEAYHQGVPLLGVPGTTLDRIFAKFFGLETSWGKGDLKKTIPIISFATNPRCYGKSFKFPNEELKNIIPSILGNRNLNSIIPFP